MHLLKNLASLHVDILTVDRGLIVHQVNMRGVMGAGLAGAIAKKWPVVLKRYLDVYLLDGLKLGNIFAVNVSQDLWVVNLVGQQDYGYVERYTDYGAVEAGLQKVRLIQAALELPVYIPYRMGCGLGGGRWSVVERIIETTIPDAIVCILP